MQASSHTPQARERLPILEHQTTRRRATRYGLFAILGAFTAVSAVATYKTMYPNKVVGFGVKVNAGTVQDIKTSLASQKYVRNSEGIFISSRRRQTRRLLSIGSASISVARYPRRVPRSKATSSARATARCITAKRVP